MLINQVLLICYHLILLFLTKAAYARRFNVQLHAAAGDVEAVRAEQDAFLDQLQQSNLSFSVRFRYTRAINAISIDIPDSNNVSLSSSPLQDIFQQQNFLTKQPLVRQYWPGKRYPRPLSPLGNNSQSSEDVKQGTPNLVEAHQMTGVHNVTWTGKGIKLAILDTGVDYTHPDLGGCFGEGCRIAHGYDLVGDHYGETDDDKPIPDSDPMDVCDGHGTHVTGIIAGSGDDQSFVGVAPEVELGIWRIFGCAGDTDDDVILEAVDRAIEAGSNIINLSLGGDQSAWQEDALAVALSNVGDLGIMVVVAQGNEGNDGIARTPSPSIGHHVMAVGSVDNKNKLAQGFKVANIDGGEPFFEYRLSGDSLSNPFPDKIRLMIPISPITNYTGSLKEKEMERHGCQPYQIPFEREKSDNDTYPIVALVKRGKCSFVEKALNLQNVGIAGMLVYEDAIESDEPLLSVGFKSKQIQIPVGSIRSDILTLLKNNSFLDIERVNQVIELPTAGLLSKFSTWGPDAELHLKPDLAAVGGSVYSTFPMNLGTEIYDSIIIHSRTMSGTSMATPYLSGCIALYMQATGSRSPAQIFQALINYAQPVVTHHQQNRLESPIKQGGGLVQIHNAIEGHTSVSPYKLELNDTQFFEPEKILYIKNKSPVQRIYYLEHQPAAAIAGYDFSKSAVPRYRPLHVNANATVQFEYTEVTIEPNSTQSIHIRFNPPYTDLSTASPRYRYYYKHLLYGGYIKISSTIRKNQKDLDNKEVEELIHVPYMGALDNQRDLPIFDTVKGYPRIEPTNKTAFSFRHRNDLLYLHIRLGNPTARLRTVLVNQENKRLGTLVDGYQKWVSRNDHTDKTYTLEWDGKIILPSSVSSSRRLSTIGSGNSMVNAHHQNFNNNSTRTINSQQQEKQQYYDKKAVVQRVVPPGRYKIRVSALKIFGDPLLKDDWEIWYSPEFDIV